MAPPEPSDTIEAETWALGASQTTTPSGDHCARAAEAARQESKMAMAANRRIGSMATSGRLARR